MEEEQNKQNSAGEQVKQAAKEAGKEAAKEGTKKAGEAILSKIGGGAVAVGMKYVLIAIAIIVVVLIAVGILNLTAHKIVAFFFGEDRSAGSSVADEVKAVVSTNSSGGYTFIDEYSEQIVEKMRTEGSIDPEAMGFITEDGENMIKKYAEAEMKTMLPKTGVSGDFDGLVKIQRLSADSGTTKELKYKKYDDWKKINDSSILDYFSINPETFELCIATDQYTIYKDFDGNEITSKKESSITKNEIEYQTSIQNYTTPLNFFLALHVIAQDVDFMNDFVDMVLGNEEPIILTYVESSLIETTQIDYEGTSTVEKTITTKIDEPDTPDDPETENVDEYSSNITEKTGYPFEEPGEDINNDNIEEYENIIKENGCQLGDHQKIVTTNIGALYVTKADSWIKKSEKKIEQITTPDGEFEENSREPFVETQRDLPSEYSVHSEGDPPTTTTTTIDKKEYIYIEEVISSKSDSKAYTVIDSENEIKVDDFVEMLQESYPRVKNNFVTSPSNIFYLLNQSESTQKHEQIMRYVIYKLTGADFGVTEDDLEFLLDDRYIYCDEFFGNDIKEKLWFTLLSLGYSKEATAGVLANVHLESDGIVSNRLEYKYAKGGKKEIAPGYTDETYTEAVDNGTYVNFVHDSAGYGIAQWTDFSRKQGLLKFANEQGVSISDENLQIEYLLGELGHSEYAEGCASNQLYNRKGYTKEQWKNAQTPEEAAVAFCWIFEYPDGDGGKAERERLARYYYDQYKDLEAGGTYVKDDKDKRVVGRFTSQITGRTFIILNQTKITGWNRCCNRAAQTSVCSGYYNASVDQWIALANKAPNLSMPRYKKMYELAGLTYSQQTVQKGTFSTEKIKTQLQGGGYIILYVEGTDQGGNGKSKYDRDWANSAHWVSILGYKNQNGKDLIFVGDSAHGNTGWVPIDEFDNITASVIFVNEKN